MPRIKYLLAVVAAALAIVVLDGTVTSGEDIGVSARPASPVRTQSPPGGMTQDAAVCNMQQLAVDGGVYAVQNDEWNSGVQECLAVDRLGRFRVTQSAIDSPTSGAPGAYPSIYRGCNWGACTLNSGMPVAVSSLLSRGTVTTTWVTAEPRTGTYDASYDIWFNRSPSTQGSPDGAELMIWLNHNGTVQPFGSRVGTVSISGRSYDVWFGKQAWNTISYSLKTGATSVRNLDIGQFAADALHRGYIQKPWYLITVEAGFELWRGGSGLATDSFAVNVSGESPAQIAAKPTQSDPRASQSPGTSE